MQNKQLIRRWLAGASAFHPKTPGVKGTSSPSPRSSCFCGNSGKTTIYQKGNLKWYKGKNKQTTELQWVFLLALLQLWFVPNRFTFRDFKFRACHVLTCRLTDGVSCCSPHTAHPTQHCSSSQTLPATCKTEEELTPTDCWKLKTILLRGGCCQMLCDAEEPKKNEKKTWLDLPDPSPPTALGGDK